MKTNKSMKNLHTILLGLAATFFLNFSVCAQETEKDTKKEMKLKVVKDVNGEHKVLDTVINISGIEGLKNLDEILEQLNTEGLDIDLPDLDQFMDINVEVLDSEEKGGEFKKVIVIKSSGDNDETIEKEYKVKIISSDESEEGKTMEVIVDGDSYGYFISDEDEIHNLDVDGDHHKIIVKTLSGGNENLFFSDDDLVWNDKGGKKVEVVETGNGKKVIVEDENGEKKEYDLKDGKGTYMINDDGEISKLSEDVKWVNDDDDMSMITVDVNDDGEVVIIKSDEREIDIDHHPGKNVFIHQSEDMEGDHDVFVEVIKKKDGEETTTVKSTIIVKTISEDDKSSMEKSGVELEPKGSEKLELANLKFHPNPNEGKFTLEFTTKDKNDTHIQIFNTSGEKVYREKIKNFEGKYKGEIDISQEKAGTYFLQITQGKKVSTRKIILE
ncbi:MAG: T9SS type A sorting domain-containing protein [Bacteroidales bacterium]|nr:T9SS type A sorting domain-containing protein [Bacteroidales bacterium]MCF8403360.1 T9SS type A sorting domain-containing protein [Bacteroidales bacterium]